MAESGDSKVKGGIRVRVGYPHDHFVHHVSGVPELSREWTEEPVADSKLRELRKVAKANGVPLEETSRDVSEEASS